MCPHPQNTVLGDCVLSKQGGAGSFCLLEVLIVIKLGAKAPKKSCCQAALSTRGSAGRPALCAEDGECRSCGEMEIMIEKVAQKWKITPQDVWILAWHCSHCSGGLLWVMDSKDC